MRKRKSEGKTSSYTCATQISHVSSKFRIDRYQTRVPWTNVLIFNDFMKIWSGEKLLMAEKGGSDLLSCFLRRYEFLWACYEFLLIEWTLHCRMAPVSCRVHLYNSESNPLNLSWNVKNWNIRPLKRYVFLFYLLNISIFCTPNIRINCFCPNNGLPVDLNASSAVSTTAKKKGGRSLQYCSIRLVEK